MKVREVTCPLDGKPCDPECPDRFHDRPEGGCVLTLAQDLGAAVKPINDEYAVIIFTPEGGDAS